MDESNQNPEEKPGTLRDFAILIERLRQEMGPAKKLGGGQEWKVEGRDSAREALLPFDFREPGAGRSLIVPADRTAVELGPPSLTSLDILMTTLNPDLVSDGRITLVGDDLSRLSTTKVGFLQAVLLALAPEADRFAMENKRFLFNRIPGYMVRSVPGRLWARIDNELMGKGFGFYQLGCALYCAFRSEAEGVLACEVVLAAGSEEMLKSFESVSRQAGALARDNRKLQLDPDGTYSCDELECETCDEKPYCDDIRDLIKYRRRKSSG